MYGVFANVATVLIGGIVGILFKRFIPEKLSDILMKALGLCTMYIGISGALKGTNTLILIISMTVGTLIGSVADLDAKIEYVGSLLEKRFGRPDGEATIASSFVTSSLVFCVGALTVIGSLNAGISADNELLYTKAMLDLVSSAVFGAALGVGVLFSSATVLAIQGGIVLLAKAASPFLTDYAVGEMTCVGSVILIGIGLNLLGVTKLKTMNFVPAIFVPIVLCLFM